MNRCILLFGMERSGTTWIGKLFDSHPDTLYRHEPDSVCPLSLPLYPENDDAPGYREELEHFLAWLPRARGAKVVGKLPLFPKSYLSAAALLAYRASVTLAKAEGRIRRHVSCLYRPTAGNGVRARLVWKSIESLGRLGVCIEALPQARAIHLMRHPCGFVASILRGEAGQRFNSRTPKADDLWLHEMLLDTDTGKRHRLSMQDIARLAPEERLAWRWVLTQEKVLADTAHCGRVLSVRYEDVCAEPVASTRRMFEFMDLDWQPQTEQFIRASTQTSESDYYSIFKNPQASANRWRSELAPESIERIMGVIRGSSLRRFYDDRIPAPTALPEVAT